MLYPPRQALPAHTKAPRSAALQIAALGGHTRRRDPAGQQAAAACGVWAATPARWLAEPAQQGTVPAAALSAWQPREPVRVTKSLQPTSGYHSAAVVQSANRVEQHVPPNPGAGETDPDQNVPPPQSHALQDLPGATPRLMCLASDEGWPRARLALPPAPQQQVPAREMSTSLCSSHSEQPGPERGLGRCQPVHAEDMGHAAPTQPQGHQGDTDPAPVQCWEGAFASPSRGAGSPFADDHCLVTGSVIA